MQRVWERRCYRCGRSNGGAGRLGRVTVGLVRRDVAALCGLMGRQAQRGVAECNGQQRRSSLWGSTSSSEYAW
jgi:hypothetical protein